MQDVLHARIVEKFWQPNSTQVGLLHVVSQETFE